MLFRSAFSILSKNNFFKFSVNLLSLNFLDLGSSICFNLGCHKYPISFNLLSNKYFSSDVANLIFFSFLKLKPLNSSFKFNSFLLIEYEQCTGT